MTAAAINPFLVARRRVRNDAPAFRAVSKPVTPSLWVPVWAKLPRAPVNASPVPRLTSLYHHEDGTEYGDRGYPGNCAGALIRDLVLFFRPRRVFDPMTGSGTCRAVCEDLGIECISRDIRS